MLLLLFFVLVLVVFLMLSSTRDIFASLSISRTDTHENRNSPVNRSEFLFGKRGKLPQNQPSQVHHLRLSGGSPWDTQKWEINRSIGYPPSTRPTRRWDWNHRHHRSMWLSRSKSSYLNPPEVLRISRISGSGESSLKLACKLAAFSCRGYRIWVGIIDRTSHLQKLTQSINQKWTKLPSNH